MDHAQPLRNKWGRSPSLSTELDPYAVSSMRCPCHAQSSVNHSPGRIDNSFAVAGNPRIHSTRIRGLSPATSRVVGPSRPGCFAYLIPRVCISLICSALPKSLVSASISRRVHISGKIHGVLEKYLIIEMATHILCSSKSHFRTPSWPHPVVPFSRISPPRVHGSDILAFSRFNVMLRRYITSWSVKLSFIILMYRSFRAP